MYTRLFHKWRDMQAHIIEDRYALFVTIGIASVGVLYSNVLYWHSPIVGGLFTGMYGVLVVLWGAKIISYLSKLSRGWSIAISSLAMLCIISTALAVPIVLLRYTSTWIAVILLAYIITARLVLLLPALMRYKLPRIDPTLKRVPRLTYEPHRYLVVLLPVLCAIGIWFLFQGRTGEFIVSPWSVIPRLYLYVYLVVTATVVLLLFSRRSVILLLGIVIAHSFFMHAYLPIVYETGFGGDKWRHLASEQYILSGAVYQPALIGEVEYTQLGPLQVPAVLVSGNKTSYGQQWALTILVSELLQVDLFWIDLWLVYVLWSLFVPILLFLIAGHIRPGRHFALLLAFTPVLFYPLQVFGSITLPVSLGHIQFLLVVWMWLLYHREPRRWGLIAALTASFSMYFGYILYFIILWLWIGLLLVWRYFARISGQFASIKITWLNSTVVNRLRQSWQQFKVSLGVQVEQTTPSIERLIKISIIVFGVALIPLLEMIQGYGGLIDGIGSFGEVFSKMADAFGHLTGLIGFLPQPGHIDQGNFLFNQTRSDHAPVSFLSFALWPLVFTVLAWVLVGIGCWVVGKLQRPVVARVFAWLLLIVMSNYVISWYLLDGNHILARRLDQVIVTLMAVFMTLGIMYFVERMTLLPWSNKVLLVGVVMAFVATSTYASGPTLQVVTADEYTAAKVVWQKISSSSTESYCVIANTWPLLAVEAVSARSIIGGGFPVGFEYAQPERVKIFEKMSQHPDQQWIDWAFDITSAPICYYMTENRWINDRVYTETVALLGQPEVIGDVYLWIVADQDYK